MENPKNCVISGGTNGVGLATAIRFAKQGGQVAICGRDQDRLNKAKSEIATFSSPDQIHTFVADLNCSAEARSFVEGAIAEMSQVDVFVNNASMAPCAPLDEMSDEAIESCINVNVKSVYYATRSIWEHMKSQGGGIIVNLSSTAAVDPFPAAPFLRPAGRFQLRLVRLIQMFIESYAAILCNTVLSRFSWSGSFG